MRSSKRRRHPPRLVAVLVVALWWLMPVQVRAASPSASFEPVGDPRGGPMASAIGDPILAAVAVVALGLASSGVTFIYLRLRSSGD